jgi:Fe2+ transport system protein FeoA
MKRRGLTRGRYHRHHGWREKGDVCTLADLNVGQRARVLDIKGCTRMLRRRMLDMGITAGVVVEIKKIAPMGDPVDVYVRDYELCMRKHDMAKIVAEVLE